MIKVLGFPGYFMEFGEYYKGRGLAVYYMS